jgi:H+/Cl- antiporter ClcA
VPPFAYKDWELLAGVGFGLLAALVVTFLIVIPKLAMVLFGRVKPIVLRATLGGALFGFLGVVLPLTVFTGSDQLKSVISNAGRFSIALLLAILVGKIVTFAVSEASGFVGGPIFPALFIGGTAGVTVHEMFNSIPLGLAFTCLFAAVPGAVVSAPFAMVLVAFMTQLGALETAPVLIAVVTAYLTIEGVKYFVVGRKREAGATAKPSSAAVTAT